MVILGGLFTSTLLNLFVLPSLYLRFGHRSGERAALMPVLRKREGTRDVHQVALAYLRWSAGRRMRLLLAGCGSIRLGPAAGPPRPGPPRAASPGRGQSVSGTGKFTAPLTVNNPMFPLAVGTQFTYQGKIVQDGETKPHSVTFTVTDLSKMVDGVQTVVAWDRDFLEGKLQEQELAFFAQDDQGNVWNFGEYPEEYENGKFTGAPSTWIRGADGAYGGIHMLSQPRTGHEVPGRPGPGDRVRRRLRGHPHRPADLPGGHRATSRSWWSTRPAPTTPPAAIRSSTTRRRPG